MQQADQAAFIQLFKDACRRCFGQDLTAPLSVAEGKLFCARVQEETGRPFDWRRVKNISLTILLGESDEFTRLHPTRTILDTLACFVAGNQESPGEGDFAYWTAYKVEFQRQLPARLPETGLPARKIRRGLPEGPIRPRGLAGRFFFHTFRGAEQVLSWGQLLIPERIRHSWLAWSALVVLIGLILIWAVREHYARKTSIFKDTFSQVSGDSLAVRGWSLRFPDSTWWAQRELVKGALTLFTLQGDNWPDTAETPHIPNLILRSIPGECFTAEVHFSDFMPTENWQQAGLMLMEDTSLRSRCIRLSIAYNDYFGGFNQPRQIIVQGVSSSSNPSGKPEEILHKTLYLLGWGKDSLIRDDMRHTALRIEKKGNNYRFLYSGGHSDNFAFQEVGSRDLYLTPRYIAVFALKGMNDTAANLPVVVRYFSLQIGPCEP